MKSAFLLRIVLLNALVLVFPIGGSAAAEDVPADVGAIATSTDAPGEILFQSPDGVQHPAHSISSTAVNPNTIADRLRQTDEINSQEDRVAPLENVATTAEVLRAVPPEPPADSDAITQTPEAAPDAEPPAFTGDTLRITVTGTRTPIGVDQLPATVTVFDLEDLQFYQMQNLRDLLRYEPGVSARDNLRYGLQDVNIRGIEGNRVLFQVDNIRLPERFQFGPFNLGRGDFVDFATLQAIEILRGPASTLYGSDALGGVVSYRSLEPGDLLGPDDTYAGDVSTLFTGATGGFDTVARIAGRLGNTEAVLVYSRRDAREADSFAEAEFVDSIDRSGTTIFGHIVQRLSPTSRVSLLAEDFNRSTRRRAADGNLGLGLNLSETEEILIDRTRISAAYEFDNPDSTSFLQFARVQLFYQDASTTEILEESRASGSAFPGQPVRRNTENEFIAESYGGEVQFRSDFSTGGVDHRLTYGLDVSNTFNSRPRDRTETNLNTGQSTNVIPPDTFPVKDFPDGNTLRLGAYLQDEIDFGRFGIIAGLRFDYYDLTTNPDEAFSRNGAQAANLSSSAFSPRIALRYEATPEVSVYGQYARGFRAPLYSEINSGFTNLTSPFFKYETLSNPELEPETSNSFEVGVRGNFTQFDFRVTGFYNTYNNFIQTFAPAGTRCLVNVDPCPGFAPPFSFDTQVVNQFQTQNISRARIYGIELGGEYRLSPDPSGFSILGSLAWTRGDDLTAEEPLATVDPIKAVLGLRYRAPGDRWRAELVGTVVGPARVADNTTFFVPEPYTVFDLIGSYNITPNLGLSLGVYNLFNTQYYNYSDVRTQPDGNPDIERFSQPGTNLRLGLSYSF
ncbi:MAG: TonB-dependent hemoglobin/transferrin/lactoferrin family receptor [Leptolyngbyaceae cyanobacterium T60_A2020_046]|nr:TonB-dependent hemoglobin/transferrin/lactoferrin family receptor [Leptolyngbyaceae cyanobacterium T60_A2020_046]